MIGFARAPAVHVVRALGIALLLESLGCGSTLDSLGNDSGGATQSGSTTGIGAGAGTAANGGAVSADGSDAETGSSGAAGDGNGTGGPIFPPKFAGNITTMGVVRSDFKTYWNQITPENEGKWGSVQPTQDTWNWAPLDAIYKYANDNDIIFKEHNFIWGSQQPSWVNSGNAQTAVRTWMQTFCQRYPNTKIIDVVNEPPPHTTPAYIDGMGGTGTTGYDWIVNAFTWARELCPNSILVLNDYNTIELSGDNAHITDIVNKIKAAGAPIDAIGAQGHGAYNVDTATVKSYIDQLATQTGLPIYITEYDINLADDAQQENVMAEQFAMFWTDSNVKGVTLWGYVEGATWLPNTGLMSESGVMRPAMTWLLGYLGR
jgi:endo-1,4-beta-xylanase